MDFSKLSDADLLAIEKGDLSAVSDAGLQVIAGAENAAVTSEPKTVKGFARNVGRSAGRAVSGIMQAGLHPIQTVTGALDLAAGGLRSLVPEGIRNTLESIPYLNAPGATERAGATFQNFADYEKDRWIGRNEAGELNALNTLYEDPVGAAMEVSAVLGGVSGLARAAGTGAKAAGMGRTAATIAPVTKGLGVAAQATNPLSIATWPINFGWKHFGRPVFEATPFSPRGPEFAGMRIIDREVGRPNMPAVIRATQNIDDVLPGGRTTAAQATANMPEASALSRIEKLTSETAGGASTKFGIRYKAQADAVKAAVTERKFATNPMKAWVRSKVNAVGGVDAAPVRAQLDSLIDQHAATPYVRSALIKSRNSLDRVTDKNTGKVIDLEKMHEIRMGLGAQIKAAARQQQIPFDKARAQIAERSVQLVIDNQINGALARSGVRPVAPGVTAWDKYLETYGEKSQKIEKFLERNELALKPDHPTTNLISGIRPDETLGPRIMERSMVVANYVMSALGKDVTPKVYNAVADILLDPASMASRMATLTAKEQFTVQQAINGINQIVVANSPQNALAE